GYREMMRCRADIRELFEDAPATLGEAAERVVRYFYERFTDDDGKPACALVRLFKTHPYNGLDRELKTFADRALPPGERTDGIRCLVLLATAGDEARWNSPAESEGHRAIPLASERMVNEAPMIAQLIRQLGVDMSTVLRPDSRLLLDANEKAYNVFFVERALGSPFIVAQEEFVKAYRIESVVGFGGMMATGDLFAAILFSKVHIAEEVADLFKVIGLNLRVSLLPLARKPLF
ncbi:MAG TPA: hypothetical protein VFT12_08810, partial [Thermoanaerobaculia bacterium]|nr:hypothetical protein [Thermoanaerobaculia bacterium]